MIHDHLKKDSSYTSYFRLKDFNVKMQKLWSDKLPSSTTKEYVRIGTILNNRKYFNTNTYGILADILETAMEMPDNRRLFLHEGSKGGSTTFVFTKSVYATLKDGTKIELAYFFNNLNPRENAKLQGWAKDFELRTLTDESFRLKMKF